VLILIILLFQVFFFIHLLVKGYASKMNIFWNICFWCCFVGKKCGVDCFI